MQQLSSYQISIWRNVYLNNGNKQDSPFQACYLDTREKPFESWISKMGPLPHIPAFSQCLLQQHSAVILNTSCFLLGSSSTTHTHDNTLLGSCSRSFPSLLCGLALLDYLPSPVQASFLGLFSWTFLGLFFSWTFDQSMLISCCFQ